MGACEEQPPEFWTDSSLVETVRHLLMKMCRCLTLRMCPNYFISKNNMMDHLRRTNTENLTIALREVHSNIDYISEKIRIHGVTDLALETPFLGKNAQNFLKLGYLRGLLYLLSNKNNLVLHEFAPRQVKQAVTGFGGASKDQVSRVVMQLFSHAIKAQKYDVTDALAVTLCGLWQTKTSHVGGLKI